jgi:addiction module HigA family antidote
MAKKLPPIHPGEILREEFLVPLKLTPYAVAAALDVPRTRIERIAREEKPVTADTALRLGKFFKTGAAFWMNIQARFDLETAEDLLAPQIKKIAPFEAARERCAVKACSLFLGSQRMRHRQTRCHSQFQEPVYRALGGKSYSDSDFPNMRTCQSPVSNLLGSGAK